MLQDLATTIEQLEYQPVPASDTLVPLLYETVRKYALEVQRDLQQTEWRSLFEGALNAGYLLCLMGDTKRGLLFLEQSVKVYQANRTKHDKLTSVILQEVTRIAQEFVDKPTFEKFQEQYATIIKSEKKEEGTIEKKILHLEADLECTVGDLDDAYAPTRWNQGLLYQKLG